MAIVANERVKYLQFAVQNGQRFYAVVCDHGLRKLMVQVLAATITTSSTFTISKMQTVRVCSVRET